jgi:hypothetical protein
MDGNQSAMAGFAAAVRTYLAHPVEGEPLKRSKERFFVKRTTAARHSPTGKKQLDNGNDASRQCVPSKGLFNLVTVDSHYLSPAPLTTAPFTQENQWFATK